MRFEIIKKENPFNTIYRIIVQPKAVAHERRVGNQGDNAMTNGQSRNETLGIASYIQYIADRIAYLKIFVGETYPLAEIKYYRELQCKIREWAKKHRVAYKYLIGEISRQEATEFMGVSERVFYRIMGKQKAEFITFIDACEKELDKKYSFIPFTNDFESIVSEVV